MSEHGLVLYPKIGTIYKIKIERVPYWMYAVYLGYNNGMRIIKYVDKQLLKDITQWKEWSKGYYTEIGGTEITFYDKTTNMGALPYVKDYNSRRKNVPNMANIPWARRRHALIAYSAEMRNHGYEGGRRRTKRVKKAIYTRRRRNH
jgi:hypothetical protein